MNHTNTVEFEVTGKYALFSAPVTRVGGEKYSLQIPTYEALKGILSSVYWKPTPIWIIDAVRILNSLRVKPRDGVAFPSGLSDFDITLEELPGLRCEVIDGI